ncbi:MAG: hypothetical protein KDJ48_16090, partial [Nitratireductor sp.]|nr:hypothetical protein [Nitratireductor sp.]
MASPQAARLIMRKMDACIEAGCHLKQASSGMAWRIAIPARSDKAISGTRCFMIDIAREPISELDVEVLALHGFGTEDDMAGELPGH